MGSLFRKYFVKRDTAGSGGETETTGEPRRISTIQAALNNINNITAIRLKYYIYQDLISCAIHQQMRIGDAASIIYYFQNKFKLKRVLEFNFDNMSKVSQHTISICMPQFILGFKNVQTNVAIKTSSNKISFENCGYLPVTIRSFSDLVNPLAYFKQLTAFDDVGNVQPCSSSNTTWLGLYSKHSILYNDELQKFDLHELKQFQASLMWSHRIVRAKEQVKIKQKKEDNPQSKEVHCENCQTPKSFYETLKQIHWSNLSFIQNEDLVTILNLSKNFEGHTATEVSLKFRTPYFMSSLKMLQDRRTQKWLPP